MKINITEDMIKGPKEEITKLFRTPDGFITNGDWLLRENIINMNTGMDIEEIDKTSKDLMERFKHPNYTDDPDFKVSVAPVYESIVRQFDNYSNVRTCVASRMNPIIFIDFNKGEFLGLLMPAISDEEVKELREARSKQELCFMLNDYKKYVEKYDLIPIEYKLEGQEGVCGMFVERDATDEYIKKQIRFAVKQNGGRWLGKFERKPENRDSLVEKLLHKYPKWMLQKFKAKLLQNIRK
jgi:hypothetical protein